MSEDLTWTKDMRADYIMRLWAEIERHHAHSRDAIDRTYRWMMLTIPAAVLILPLLVTVPFTIFWARRIRWHEQQAMAIAKAVADGSAFPWRR